jgi:hypothetical protein
LLANCYLHQFDEWYRQRFASPDKRTDPRGYERWRYRHEKGKDVAATQMFRYADDVRHFTGCKPPLLEREGPEEHNLQVTSLT